ncbi:MAG: hypothetical protein OJF60_000768 [Burkholderiaceae bacterium]|nr:MAG: hypothetical protein OJF60_000768 [Burkholderiaceae bacterium]
MGPAPYLSEATGRTAGQMQNPPGRWAGARILSPTGADRRRVAPRQ